MHNIPANIQAVPYDYTVPPNGSHGAYKRERRWLVVDATTGLIIYDANGCGYKSAQDAFETYIINQRAKELEKHRKKIASTTH